MSVLFVTHEYGSTRRGVLIDSNPEFQIVREMAPGDNGKGDKPTGEAHILMYQARDLTAKVGDIGTLTFTDGGPTKAFWKFKADK